MNYETYIEKTRETFNYQDELTDLKHVLLGIIDEVGELAKVVKRKVGYGKTIDITNVKEEMGDLSYYIAQLLDQMKFSPMLKDRIYADVKAITKTTYPSGSDPSMFDHIRHLSCYAFNVLTSMENKSDNAVTQIIIQNSLYMIQVMNRIAHSCGTTYPKILEANIAKLKKRKEANAIKEEENRDREEEAKQISKNS